MNGDLFSPCAKSVQVVWCFIKPLAPCRISNCFASLFEVQYPCKTRSKPGSPPLFHPYVLWSDRFGDGVLDSVKLKLCWSISRHDCVLIQEYVFIQGILHVATPLDGCQVLLPPPVHPIPHGYGWVALIERSSSPISSCQFIDKVCLAYIWVIPPIPG